MLYYETHSTDPCYNLAFEEALFESHESGEALILWQNRPSVIIGLNQNAASELDCAMAERLGVAVVRRMSGGGAVYHDLGNLNYSFISAAGAEEGLERFARPVCAALRGLGLEAELSGRNDILVGGKKVSGVARRVSGSKVLQHGTLLFDSELERLSALLRPDERKLSDKATKSVRSRVTNIRPLLRQDMDMAGFWEYLKQSLSAGDFCPAAASDRLIERARSLAGEKYSAWEWNRGRDPRYAFNNSARFPEGCLAVSMDVSSGRIERIGFSADLMGDADLSAAAEALAGCPLERAGLISRLSSPSLLPLFGGIPPQAVAALILGET